MSSIFYVSYAVLWLVVLMQGGLLLLVYRHFGLAAMNSSEGVDRDGIAIGVRAISIPGVNNQGQPIEWTHQAGRTTLLAFVSFNCSPCEKIIPSLLQLASLTDNVHVVLVVTGNEQYLTKLQTKFCIPDSVLCIGEGSNDIHQKYRVRVTPYAFVVGKDGLIRSKGLCNSPHNVKQMLSEDGLDISESELEPALRVIS